jgi:hypothetical protein
MCDWYVGVSPMWSSLLGSTLHGCTVESWINTLKPHIKQLGKCKCTEKHKDDGTPHMQEESALSKGQRQSVAQYPMTSAATATTSRRGSPPHVLFSRELEAEVQDLGMCRMMHMQQTQKTRKLQKEVSIGVPMKKSRVDQQRALFLLHKSLGGWGVHYTG